MKKNDIMPRDARSDGPVETKVGKRGAGATTMTLSISAEDKYKVKDYALRHQTTVSDLLHGWIEEHCSENRDD